MTAIIIPFPGHLRAEPEDFFTTFKNLMEENRRLNRQFNLTGPEWLEILDLLKTGLSKSEAAKIVVGRRGS